MKNPFIIHADLECLLEKIGTCYNNPNKSSTTKINKHTPSGYSLFTHCSYDVAKYKLGYYRGYDSMKNFYRDLRGQAMRIINHEKKEMIPLTIEKKKSFYNQKVCHICKKEFNTLDNDKVKDNCHFTGRYRGVAHNICNLIYKLPKEIPIVVHNGST